MTTASTQPSPYNVLMAKIELLKKYPISKVTTIRLADATQQIDRQSWLGTMQYTISYTRPDTSTVSHDIMATIGIPRPDKRVDPVWNMQIPEYATGMTPMEYVHDVVKNLLPSDISIDLLAVAQNSALAGFIERFNDIVGAVETNPDKYVGKEVKLQ